MTAILTQAQIRAAKPTPNPGHGAPRLTMVSFFQTVLNPFNLAFALAMPIFMYLLFGANQPYSDHAVGAGNMAGQTLVSMTLFGVLLSIAAFGANVSLERVQGVGRLYALTPLGVGWQIFARLMASVGVAAIVIIATYLVGFGTGASMSALAWISTALMLLVSSLLAAAIGFGCGFAMRSDSAFAANSAVIVLGAFSSGMTIPLEQMGEFFQKIASWAPLWGANQLTLLPLRGWDTFTPNMVINFVVWTGIFSALAVWGLKRDTGR